MLSKARTLLTLPNNIIGLLMSKVLILGGYGNFGARIATALLKKNIAIIIAGRDSKKANALHQQLMMCKESTITSIEVAVFDANLSLATELERLKPTVVINTIGPFQSADYSIATTCILHGVHYLDLADAREFVADIHSLNALATQHQVLVVSGASTVPGLSSAVLEHYKNQFLSIDSLKYGISPGQKAPRGLATTQSILTYLGKPLKPWGSEKTSRFGWQNIYLQDYPKLGKRWMANCDIPDLDLFPNKYHIPSIQFSAGMESGLLHLGMWILSWLIRFGIPLHLEKHAHFLLNASHIFDCFGTDNGGMHMLIRGKMQNGQFHEINWYIIAEKGDGPQIPCVPAIILAEQLVKNEIEIRGALPCVGLVSLEKYMHELKDFSIRCIVK